MDTFRKTFAALCAILFVITGVMALFLFNFDRRAFSAETYQQAFARGDFYNTLPALMAEVMTSATTDTSQFPIVMQGMSTQAWEAFLRSLLPTDTLKAMSDDVLISTFNYLNMRSDSVQLNLAPLKASMESETGVQAVISLLGTLPNCTAAQIAQITVDALTNGTIEFCNPPAEFLPVLTPIIQGQLQVTASAFPDQMTIITAPLQDDPRLRLQTVRFLMRLSPLLPLVFLLGLTVLGVRSLKGWLNWWGVSLAITGIAALLLSLTGGPIFGNALAGFVANRVQNFLPAAFLAYASDLAAAMADALLRPVLWQGLILFAIGSLMAGTAYFIGRNEMSASRVRPLL